MTELDKSSAFPPKRSFEELYRRYPAFYELLSRDTARRMSDPFLLRMALGELSDQQLRTPVFSQKPLEFLLQEADRFRSSVMSEAGKKGRRRNDELQDLIEQQVASSPTLSCSELLRCLKKASGFGLIHSVTDETIEFGSIDIREVKITSLKDRLSRAKKKSRMRL